MEELQKVWNRYVSCLFLRLFGLVFVGNNSVVLEK